MEHAITSLPTLTVGFIQEEGPLPNSVPGLGADGGGAIEGQAAGGGAGGTPGQAAPASPFGNSMFLILGLVMVFMIFTTMMSGRREKKRAAEMLASLKRGDRVLTVGGMIGTVHELRDDSIVLRVDDVSGAKAHFTRAAVQRVLKSGKSDSNAEATTEAD